MALWLGLTAAIPAQQAEPSAPERITVTINTQQTAETVSKYEFGMFIEHIGPLIYRSLWSEMLDDRKFYFPISSAQSEPALPPSNGPSRQFRKWIPVGPDNVVTMDKDEPFTGNQSPRIKLDSAKPHGVRQTGLSVLNGKKYTGRIYLRGTPGARIEVVLI